MSTLNFTIKALDVEFNDFADRMGYMSTIINELDLPVTNPESRSEFLVRTMKEKVASVFYTPFVTAIEQEVRDGREVDKEAMKTEVRGRVAVNFVV